MTTVDAVLAQANALTESGRPDEAAAILRPLLAGGTGPIPLWAALAKALRHLGRPREALPIQEMLVQTAPSNMGFRFDLSETLLLLGDFERGWREYHWRYSMAHTTAIARKVQRPRWDGRPAPGRTLLIHDEQGFGDSLQFMRMAAWARQRSQARVVLEMNPNLLSLAARAGGFDQLIARGTVPPPFDIHCETMSLPMVMGLRILDLPGTIPYLTPDPERLRRWESRLAGLSRPLVALAWAGRPQLYNGQNRAVSLATLAPLAMEGVTFLAVQKGPQAAEANAPPAGMNLLSLSDEIADFEDTAAILSIADLLISIDSAPAHLAGALGRPAWVMLGYVADWRWLLDRDDSPWYPTLRLFRQEARGDWTGVVRRLAAALEQLALAEFRDK